MIQLLYIISSVLCMVIGVYAVVLLHQLRNRFKNEFLDSLFYYQLLSLIFGIYGILGSLLIREILPKFGLANAGIEAISHFIPFLGLPFLITGWFMFIKMAIEISNKKLPQLVAIGYFVLATVLFLLFGLYLLRLSDIKIESWNVIRNNVFVGFALCTFVVETCVVFVLLISTLGVKNKLLIKMLYRTGLIVLFFSLAKAALLYFYDYHFSLGIYFLVFYFSGLIPVVFVVRNYLETSFVTTKKVSSYKEKLFEKYGITPREKDIIEEICGGKANKEIAESLFITLQTVKDHTHNIFQKTEVKNRVQLAKLFSEPPAK